MSFGGPVVAGTRIGNETYDAVSAEAVIRPLHDQIIVEPLEWRPSDIISVVYWGKPLRGKVKAVGPGKYPWKYIWKYNDKTQKRERIGRKLSKYFVPTQVKIGAVVELGGLELGGYLFQTFRWGSIEHVICTEQDITGIVSDVPESQASMA
jgi:hypothetical protein